MSPKIELSLDPRPIVKPADYWSRLVFYIRGFCFQTYTHQLRHGYATHLLNNGAPIEVIQSLMGHEKSETTRIYAELSGQLRKEFYR
ncbi:tyrosine-type recombinase/integrase [Priestia megaterium]|uniref:tyrosine-type recombinase/integrase n=1 Tax=Priestia megaterium TaxID=1404 RepID=UPI001FB1F6DE|nr:tyrosine-type recombinase/integrase [Priestia megaterium]